MDPFPHYSYPYDKETKDKWIHAPVDISGNKKVITSPKTK